MKDLEVDDDNLFGLIYHATKIASHICRTTDNREHQAALVDYASNIVVSILAFKRLGVQSK